MVVGTWTAAAVPEELPAETARLRAENAVLRAQVQTLQSNLARTEDRRRAMLHIMADLSDTNRRLAEQRRAMLHILVDYEGDRRQLAEKTNRLDRSRRALLHILQDSHQSNLRLESSRKAMIHIMDDLHHTTEEMQERETELREKQEQLVQTAKLATLGELTTGIAHELNNPLNNIGLFLGNVLDHLDYGEVSTIAIRNELRKAMQQVRKATEIISHLRTFGRATTVTREPVAINEVIRRSVSLIGEQLRLREIDVRFGLTPDDPMVPGHAIQLEQVFVNLLTNARDALAHAELKRIEIASARYVDGAGEEGVVIRVRDTGTGIPAGQEKRIFDPFFTTKEVGQGTGLGLSIIYGIVNEHRGTIEVENHPAGGAIFTLRLPTSEPPEED